MSVNQVQDVRHHFEQALEAFLEAVRQDKSILAAMLFGSLVDGNVWEKSDMEIGWSSRTYWSGSPGPCG